MEDTAVAPTAAGRMPRLRPSRRLTTVAAALVVAAIAVVGTQLALGPVVQEYRATAQVVLVPAATTAPEDVPSAWESLYDLRGPKVAAAVLAAPRWVGPAAQAAGVPATALAVTATPVAGTSQINLTATTTDPRAAETALTALVQAATPLTEQLSGPFSLVLAEPATGTGAPTGIPRVTWLAIAGVGGLLLVAAGVALLNRRDRRRAERSPAGHGGGAAPAAVPEEDVVSAGPPQDDAPRDAAADDTPGDAPETGSPSGADDAPGDAPGPGSPTAADGAPVTAAPTFRPSPRPRAAEPGRTPEPVGGRPLGDGTRVADPAR
ncbi:hypothetical protein [Pseudonocardia sp. D17]|uniref:hypothetical protein n=1 Tax=Pseudonocardia sp. D17 TaxID=882661 RepID=UPI002B3D80BC|nr:hypothetical protein PSD17_01790 [Pseudonocardia sp. D17]